MFRSRSRREVRQGTYVLHFAASGEESGAFQFLSKPVDFDLLKGELRRLQDGSAMHRFSQ